MSGAWRGLSVASSLSLHLQINSLLTEKKINCHNESLSAKPFNWSIEWKYNYLRNNCMKINLALGGGGSGDNETKRRPGNAGRDWAMDWTVEDEKPNLKNTYSTILKLQKALFYCSERCEPKKKKMGRIKLHYMYNMKFPYG